MSPSRLYVSKDVETEIGYWRDPGDGSLPDAQHALDILLGDRDLNTVKTKIRDMRNIENQFTLDKNGFQTALFSHEAKMTKDAEEIKESVYPDIVRLIQEIAKPSKMVILNHIVRDAPNNDNSIKDPQYFLKRGSSGPARRPHVDFEGGSCASFWSTARPDLADDINYGRRWQILGVWIPLKTVKRDPFAVLDESTAPASDFVVLRRDYGGLAGGNYVLKHGDGPEHHWYYLHHQQPNEALVFKHFDSRQDEGIARRCGHVSFGVPETADLPPRESIEFRVFVLY